MRTPVSETVDLVFDGWAIARTNTFDLARVHRRTVQVFGNDLVGCGRRMRDEARNLWRGDRPGENRKRYRLIVTLLLFQQMPGNRRAIKPCWRSGFQPSQLETKCGKLVRDTCGWRLTIPASRYLLFANMDQSVEEGPGRQHHCAGMDHPSITTDDTGEATTRHVKPGGRSFDHRKIGVTANLVLHCRPVNSAIRLGARSTHCRTL